MGIVNISSPKGGVGKSTLATNMAAIFADNGMRTLLIDYDPQNAVRVFFNLPLTYDDGWYGGASKRHSLFDHLVEVRKNLFLLPFGKFEIDARAQLTITDQVSEKWLATQLQGFLSEGFLILNDTAAGGGVTGHYAANAAALEIIVLEPDPSSLALLDPVEWFRAESKVPVCFILNKTDPTRHLARDMEVVMTRHLGQDLLGCVRRDQHVPEALARRSLFVDQAPNASSTNDLYKVADKLLERYGARIGVKLDEGRHQGAGLVSFAKG